MIDKNSCDWFKFISLFSFRLFVNSAESVNKHFNYIFSYFCYDLQLYECIIAAATASFFRSCLFLESKISAGSTPCVAGST